MKKMLNLTIKHCICFVLFFFFSFSLSAQKTVIYGEIKETKTGEPMPYVNVKIEGIDVGTTSDEQGKYTLETSQKCDTIVFSFIGFKTEKRAISPGQIQTFDIYLTENDLELQEMTVKAPDEDPALILLRKVIKAKPKNNPDQYDYLEYDSYSKVQLDLNNLTEKFKDRKIFKKFDFIMKYIDTLDGAAFLPALLSESTSEVYYRKSPESTKEVVTANQVSGFDNESISKFAGDLYFSVNIYENYLNIFNKDFISPISNSGESFYKYYLMDSATIDGYWCYQIRFIPKRIGDLTFRGDMWINDSTFAVKQVKGRISAEANLNFVENLQVEQYFTQIDSSWVLKKEKLFADFEATEEFFGIFGRRTSIRSNISVNQPLPNEFFDKDQVELDTSAMEKDSSYWAQNRPEPLTKEEWGIYKMIDSLNNHPTFKFYKKVVQMFYSGYYIAGPVEIGNLYSLYSFNAIEDHRFQLSLRTSNDFSKRVEFHGYGAYGIKDNRWKYGLGGRWKTVNTPRGMMYLDYYNDYEQLGNSPDQKSTASITNSLLSRTVINRLTSVERMVFKYEQDLYKGFRLKVGADWKEYTQVGALPYQKLNDAGLIEDVNRITTFEVNAGIRYAPKEKFLSGEFDRISLGTDLPVITLDYTKGIKDVIRSNYNYHKLRLSILHRPKIGVLGRLKYEIFAGKIWGNLPYPFLEVHPGNQSYYYQEKAFNLMDFFEFISDQYVGIFYEHYFNGFILDKIPLIKHMKWRSVFTTKAVWGSVSNQHNKEMLLPAITRSVNKPYVEVGFGIGNILRFLRIDFVWRVSNKKDEAIYGNKNFGIFGKFQVDF